MKLWEHCRHEMREPRDVGPFPDFDEGKTPAKRPPGGKPPCFIRIYFPRERFNFQIRPSQQTKLPSKRVPLRVLFAKEGSKVAKKTFFDHQKRE